jgi:phage-related protein (TIGR01555 family)
VTTPRTRRTKPTVVHMEPKPKRRGLRVTAEMAALARVDPKKARAALDPFTHVTNLHPPAVTKSLSKKQTMAMDTSLTDTLGWATQSYVEAARSEGQQFLGYSELSLMAQRAEYRRIVERTAQEMTRKWITFETVGDDRTGANERIEKIEEEMKRLGVRAAFQEAAEQDGYFGRGHIFLDFGDADNPAELKMPIGNGLDDTSRQKVSPTQPLRRIKCVEAIWSYPLDYNSIDPLATDWYRPKTWKVMSKDVHASRFLTFVGREVPDLLKPSYSFGGLSLTQMAKPYVDNWLRTRQNVADVVASFTQFVLETSTDEALSTNETELFERADFFNRMRDVRGLLIIDHETEGFQNVSAPLGTLDKLQAQSQEQMAAVCGLPLVVLLGIQPAGLNATSEGELETFAAWISAQQEALFRTNLERIIGFIQLSLFGDIDPSITFKFNSIRELNEKEKSELRKTKAEIGKIHIEAGVLSIGEERQRIAADKESGYESIQVGVKPDMLPKAQGELAVAITNAVMQANEAGVISDMTTLKELKAQSMKTGVFTKISEADIALAEHEADGSLPPQPDLPPFGAPGALGAPGAPPGGDKPPGKHPDGSAQGQLPFGKPAGETAH